MNDNTSNIGQKWKLKGTYFLWCSSLDKDLACNDAKISSKWVIVLRQLSKFQFDQGENDWSFHGDEEYDCTRPSYGIP